MTAALQELYSNMTRWSVTSYKRLWEPSQKGLFAECLQAHQATVLAAGISALIGANSVPLWEPSQKGWEADRPQAHHQYVPGSTFCTMGLFWNMIGSLMPFFVTRRVACRKSKPPTPLLHSQK
jgi:hypothetical protein